MNLAIADEFHDGTKFDVVTDNNPLTYIQTVAKLDACGHIWVVSLANYDFKIHCSPGKTHVEPDTLSRKPNVEPETTDDSSDMVLDGRLPEKDVMQAIFMLQIHSTEGETETEWESNLQPSETQPFLKDHDWISGQDADPTHIKIAFFSGSRCSHQVQKFTLRYESPVVRKYLRQFGRLQLYDKCLIPHSKYYTARNLRFTSNLNLRTFNT